MYIYIPFCNINYLASYPFLPPSRTTIDGYNLTIHNTHTLFFRLQSIHCPNFLRETKFLFFEIVYHELISTVLRGGEEEEKEKLDLRAEIPIADFIKTRQRTWAVLIKRGVAYPCFSIQDRMELKRKLHCKPFSWYLKNVYPELVIPTSEGGPGGSLKQGSACLDSMGHLLDGNVGLYPCHDTGGNQVSMTLCYSCCPRYIFEYTAMK